VSRDPDFEQTYQLDWDMTKIVIEIKAEWPGTKI
jgi:hypothetical protein